MQPFVGLRCLQRGAIQTGNALRNQWRGPESICLRLSLSTHIPPTAHASVAPRNLPFQQCLTGISEDLATHIKEIPRDYQALLFLAIFRIAK